MGLQCPQGSKVYIIALAAYPRERHQHFASFFYCPQSELLVTHPVMKTEGSLGTIYICQVRYVMCSL